jgi:hypothetical protein
MASKLDFVRFPAPDGVNGWWESLPPAAPANSVTGEQRFDFVVVGSRRAFDSGAQFGLFRRFAA